MENKVYLILGASSDLGIALIKSILQSECNAKIIAHYHCTCTSLLEMKEEYIGATIELKKADLSDLVDVDRFIAEIQADNLVPTHIVSFSASTYHFNRLQEWNKQRINVDMTIQVYAFAEILKAFLPLMVQNKYGKIVTMLSSSTIGIPPKYTSEYVTVKYALLGLIKCLASDYGEYGININAVSPGMIETKFIKGIGRKIKEYVAESNPRHRNLTIEDVVPAILFLLSDQSEFANGTNINLSGFPA